MTSRRTKQFRAAFAELPSRVQRQARKAFRLFRSDPTHPSLHFKAVDPAEPIFSIRVSIGYRALAFREGEDPIWFWIGSHAEYERLLKRR